jgi:hypothetical protein
MKLTRMALGSVVAVSLLGAGLMGSSALAQHGDNYGGGGGDGGGGKCVTISGGTVMNETVIDISADAGTAITDASAGSNNMATTSGGHGAAGSVDTASAGNGGVATAGANGGAVSLGDINSGGNAGNAISVGDTWCNAAAPYEAAPEAEAAAAEVVALPSTGVGFGDASSLFALLASAGAGVTALGLRRR